MSTPTLDERALRELSTYVSWFRDQHQRPPLSLVELAKFLDDERSHGQFADNPAVQGVYGLAHREDASAIFIELMQHIEQATDIHYHITLRDGNVVDVSRPDPRDFHVGGAGLDDDACRIADAWLSALLTAVPWERHTRIMLAVIDQAALMLKEAF